MALAQPRIIAQGILVQSMIRVKPGRATTRCFCFQAEAERRLLAAALSQPRNQRFMLLSEACLPLYPPHVMWAEAFTYAGSRVHACKADTPQDEQRRNLDK